MEAHPSIVDEPMAVEADNTERERCRAAGDGPRGHAHRRGPRVAVEEAQGVLQNCLYAHVHDSPCPKHVPNMYSVM